MRVTAKKWGNSASIRILVGVMEAARLHWTIWLMFAKRAGVS
jgi:antitoxin component of MazEF toxin-antitoxin module